MLESVSKSNGLGRGMVVLVLMGGLLNAYGCSSRAVQSDISTFRAEKGELLVSVTEDGNVESASNVDIRCQVAGGSSILWIIEDGTNVKKGDKLVELDSATLEDEINTQRIAYNKAKSLMIQAEKTFEVSKIAVEEYKEGTFKKELQDAESAVVVAEENLRSAKSALEYSEKMFQRGYISSQEIETQTFAVRHAQLNLDSAKTAKEVLEKFTKRKMLEDLTSAVETAKVAMESEEAAFNLEDGKLKKLETQLENCTIVAPQDGMVVYANEQARRSSQAVVVEEGATVRDRQTILRLPDLSTMQVKVRIHETRVEDVEIGMGARISIQGRQLQGHVTAVANQHEPTHWFSGDVKEYATIVRIDGEVESIKPGMTAEVEIKVAHKHDVLKLPISTILELSGRYYCWAKTATAFERRELTLGMTDDQFVEVISGVEEGEEIALNPRGVADPDELAGGDLEAEEKGKFGSARDVAPQAGGPGGKGKSPAGGPATGGRGGDGAGGGLMSHDKDGDGKISKDEAPAFMTSFFDKVDGNGDGYVDAKEIASMKRNRPAGGGAGGGAPGAGGSGPPAGGR